MVWQPGCATRGDVAIFTGFRHARTLRLEGGNEVWVYAGTVFGLGVPERVGPDEDIHVPPMFFKIVVLEDADPDVETPVFGCVRLRLDEFGAVGTQLAHKIAVTEHLTTLMRQRISKRQPLEWRPESPNRSRKRRLRATCSCSQGPV